jgi:ketosteroid isomerase-like protein
LNNSHLKEINLKPISMKKNVLLFCTFIALIGCNTAPKLDIQGEKDAIQSNEDQWTVALQKRDAEKIVGFYATEAVSMRSNQPIYIGLNAIRNGIQSMLADTTLLFNTYTGKLDAIEVSVAGDMAYSYGHDEIMVKTKDGLVKDEGKWVDVWKKLNGQWRVIVSCGNSNKPLTGK